MLNVYIGNKPKELIIFNDGWFNTYADLIDFEDKTVQNIMKIIDGVNYAGDLMFFSKFKKNAQVSVSELSSGCKTAINVYSFQNKIFSLAECGNNALRTIFGLKNGNGYVKYYIYPGEFYNKVNIIINNKSIVVSSNKEMDKVLSSYFEEVYNGNR